MTDDMNGEIYVEPPFQAVIIPPESTALEPEAVLLAPEPVDLEPETAPSSGGEVVSVEELLDRLAQAEQNTGDTPETPAEDTGG